LGKSPEEGFWRLYPTPELDEYVEIAEADIVFSRPLSEAVAPLGGTAIVINASALLRGVSTDRAEARAAFLQGDITRNAVAALQTNAVALSTGTLENKNFSIGFWCNVSILFACGTHVVHDVVCTAASGKLCGTARLLP
jgi:hypothetical protein